MRKLVGAYFDCKNTQRHQFDYRYSIKIFIGFIKCVGMSEVMFKPPKQKSQTSLMFGMDATNL
ncbi:hypothetical protein VN0495_04670 [Helicobacter pylori]|nr:hypothetical protein VN0495_04670 [Helicobacter pylori]